LGFTEATSWRRAITFIVFGGLLFVAFWQISWGLPEPAGDEVTFVVDRMLTDNTWNPRYFWYPTFLIHVCTVPAKLFHAIGFERLGVSRDVGLGLVCRSVSALFYLSTVAVLARTVRVLLDLKGTPFALYFFGSIGALQHHAHVATVNSNFFFSTALALYAFARTLRHRRELDFYLSVTAASFAVGNKYNAAFLLGALPVLWLVTFRELRTLRFLRALLVSIVIMPLPFALTNPYIVIDPQSYAAYFQAQRMAVDTYFKTSGGFSITLDSFSQMASEPFPRSHS
jgi:hypothetical protein